MDFTKLPIAWQFLAAGMVVAIAFADKLGPLVASIAKTLARLTPAIPTPDDIDDIDEPPTDADAYVAARLLVAYYERERCQAGLQAAREAGRHLFHDKAHVEEVHP